MTPGSKPPGKRGGGTQTCSFCGSFDIVRRIGDFRFCEDCNHRVLPDDAAELRRERRKRNAHLIPPPVRI